MNITKHIIEDACGAGAYRRGQSYHRQNHVLSCDWFELEGLLEGEVRGSGRNIYEQVISFVQQESGHLFIEGYCSCPVGYNCKHVVAVLLEAMTRYPDLAQSTSEQENNREVSALQRWQETIRSQQQQLRQFYDDRADTTERMLYLLDSQARVDHTRIVLNLARTRLLKSGGYGKTHSFQLHSYYYYSYYNLPAWINQADQAILKRLQLSISDSGDHKAVIKGDDGALLLKELIQTGRCHLHDKDHPPLRLGPAKAVQFSWQRNADGLHQLRVQPEDLNGTWICCPTEPPWYIDPEQALCGPLLSVLSGALLDPLCYLPAVPETELEELSRFIFRTLPPRTVPLPIELAIIDIVDQPPTPVLTLLGLGENHDLLAARLNFRYRDVQVRPGIVEQSEQAYSQHDRYEYRIQRDMERELAALTILAELDFYPLETERGGDSENLYLAFPGETLSLRAMRWNEFLSTQRPQLEAQGWVIEQDASFQLQFLEPKQWLSTLREARQQPSGSGHNWFELALSLEVEGYTIELLPVLTNWLQQIGNRDLHRVLDSEGDFLIALEAGVWVRVPLAQLRPVLEILVELFDGSALSGDSLALPRSQAAALLELEQALIAQGVTTLHWQGGEMLRELAAKLHDFSGIQPVAIPEALQATLRPYQAQGLNWLQFLREFGFGGILADDMGLGKTVQTLAHLLIEKQAGRLKHPALVVVPTSLISNWRHEIERFAPDLQILILHGPERKKIFSQINRHDLILTTYALLHRDETIHLKHHYHSVILDEAQAIKNPVAKTTQSACAINADQRLCLTGTPLENNLGELWSLFHFLMPGFLGHLQRFNKLFRHPIERDENPQRQQELVRRISPFILRRTKQEVATELPPKTEILQNIALSGDQALLYESIRVAMETRVRQLLKNKGLARSHIEVLDALLKLRQACCDPRLVKLESAAKVKQSAKLTLLMEMLPEMLAEGRKVLLFSQFTSMLTLIEQEFKKAKLAYSKLTGQTRKREEAIAAFQSGKVPVFLVSLKAGGVGLNLTAADTVILYDPWWNPATEQQAIDRAYRIGQDKPVFVYKLIAEHTVEEKILTMQQKKQALAEAVYGAGGQAQLPLNADEILDLFRPAA